MCMCVNTIYVYRIQLADGAWELTNAGRAVFGNDIKRLMCWSHKYRAYKPKLAGLRKINKLWADNLKEDIIKIQWMLTSFNEFICVYEHLQSKYLKDTNFTSEEKELLKTFFCYHRSQWGPNSHVSLWWEGANPYQVSNNQGIESKNLEIKEIHSFRERLEMGSFCEMLGNIVRENSSRDDTLLCKPCVE